MTLNEALAIIERDTANGRIGAALRANSPQALELFVAIRGRGGISAIGEQQFIEAVQVWENSSIGAKGE